MDISEEYFLTAANCEAFASYIHEARKTLNYLLRSPNLLTEDLRMGFCDIANACEELVAAWDYQTEK